MKSANIFTVFLRQINWQIKLKNGKTMYRYLLWYTVYQDPQIWTIPAEFSSNPNQTHLSMLIRRRVWLETALSRMITSWHQSTARAIRMHRIRLLSYRSRGTLMSYGDHSAQRCFKSNAPSSSRSLENHRQVSLIRLELNSAADWTSSVRFEEPSSISLKKDLSWSLKAGPITKNCTKFIMYLHQLCYIKNTAFSKFSFELGLRNLCSRTKLQGLFK